jgi:hypothetical protein
MLRVAQLLLLGKFIKHREIAAVAATHNGVVSVRNAEAKSRKKHIGDKAQQRTKYSDTVFNLSLFNVRNLTHRCLCPERNFLFVLTLIFNLVVQHLSAPKSPESSKMVSNSQPFYHKAWLATSSLSRRERDCRETERRANVASSSPSQTK